VQAGRRLVEDEELRCAAIAPGCLREKLAKLEALRFTARERVQRLAELQIAKPDFREWLEQLRDLLVSLGVVCRQSFGLTVEGERFLNAKIENVGDRLAEIVEIERGWLVAAAIAIRAGDVQVGEELHFHLLAAGTGAAVTAAFAGVEGKEASLQAARLRIIGQREELTDGIEGAEQHRRCRTRRPCQRRLIHEQHVLQVLRAS
jgi:hypothetical protein